jgi:hypothetical protein
MFTLVMLCFAASAQTLRSPNDPRNQSPTVGTGGPSGGPTGLFTIYDGSTLRKGEYTFSLAYSNYDRDPGNVDLTVIPGSFQVGLNDYVELFFNMDLYRGIKVNSPRNLSAFYLPNSQVDLGIGVLGSAPAVILAPSGPNVGTLANRAVFRYPLCVNAGCSTVFPLAPVTTGPNPLAILNGLRFWGQPFAQYPYVGAAGPNFGQGSGSLGTLFGFPGFSTTLGPPRAAANSGNFGGADVFPGIGSPVGGILPGVVLATNIINNPPANNTLGPQFVPATFTIAPTYLPDAPFLNRTYGESSFSQAVVGGKIRLTAPNSPYGLAILPMYRFYLDKADDTAGFNQMQRGSGAGGDIGDFGLVGVFDARLSRSVNVSVNAGYWLNSNPKGQFPSGEFTLLDRPDELLMGIGFDFPVNKYFQPILEVRSTQYVGGRTPNSFENSPVEGLAGVKIYPRRWFGMGFAYRYHANQQDRDGFEARNFATSVSVAGIPNGVLSATSVLATAGGFPRGFVPSDDPHGFIGQFWIGRRNARTPPAPKNQPPTVKLNASATSVKLPAACGEGQRPNPNCTPNSEISLRTTATDPDNDVLLYSYTTTGGKIVGDGANVTWDLTGAQPGTYRANVYVKDGNGHEVCDWVTVNVEACDCVAAPAPTPPPCASATLSGPDSVKSNETATISANVSNAPAGMSYNWTVSCGTIVSGQGSPTITVDNSNCAGRSVTATLEMGGLAPECPPSKSFSYSVVANPERKKIDEFSNIQRNDDKARLDNLVIALQQDPGAQGYIIIYGTCGNTAQARYEFQKNYLVNSRGVEAGRLMFIDGGCKDQLTTELWIVPQGATPPSAEGGTPCSPCKRGKGRRGDDEEEEE